MQGPIGQTFDIAGLLFDDTMIPVGSWTIEYPAFVNVATQFWLVKSFRARSERTRSLLRNTLMDDVIGPSDATMEWIGVIEVPVAAVTVRLFGE